MTKKFNMSMKVNVQNINNIARTSGFHLIIWVALFSLNFLFLDYYKVTFNFNYHIKIWLIYISVFYINYYLIIPEYLLKKKSSFYSLSTMLLFVIAIIIKINIEKNQFTSSAEINRAQEKKIKTTELLPAKNSELNTNPFSPSPDKFMSFYGLLLVITASTSIRFIRKWQDDEKRKTEVEKEKLTNELSFLKQQINPHFLFNALNNIYSLTLNTSSKASDALLKLSSILRYMLYET
jgi:two-component system, LytTR family, sensor kinase